MGTPIADSEDLEVQFLGRARDGELIAVIGRGDEVTPDSEIHRKMPFDADWASWGSVRDLGAWRPPFDPTPPEDVEIPQDPELPAYDPASNSWALRHSPVFPMDASKHTWRIGHYPYGGGELAILEWDR